MNFLREIVSGRKRRFQSDGFNLDLTYVCNRIIAMAFPASGIESTYRNSIEDVAQFLQNKHAKRYQVYNLSGRKYEYSKLNNQVYDFQWEDHHSPSINLLFEICQKIDNFLKENQKNIIVVHCLAGKGRTGTVICCYLMYSGRMKTPEEALEYYAKKRFAVEGLGVTQPSQIRYIYYFHQLLRNHKISPTVQLIEYVKIYGIPAFNNKTSCKPYIEIYSMKTLEKLYSNKKVYGDQPIFKKYMNKKDQNNKESDSIPFFVMKSEKLVPVYGDLLIKVINNGIYRNRTMFRFAFNTAFIPENKIMNFMLKDLDPDSVQKSKKFPPIFNVEVKLKDICKCTNLTLFPEKCSSCQKDLVEEQSDWNLIYQIMNNYTQKTIIESKTLLFGDPGCDDVEEILSNKLLQPTSTEQKSSDSEEEDDLQKIFHQVLTRKASEKLANSEIIENDKEEEEKKNELNDKKIKLGKTKSFEVQNNDWILDILKNDIKSKEN